MITSKTLRTVCAAVAFIVGTTATGLSQAESLGYPVPHYIKEGMSARDKVLAEIKDIEPALNSMFEGNFEDALAKFRTAAARGNPSAMNSIGSMYEHGMGVEQDYEQARDWYEIAIRHGNSDAIYNLAWLYFQGTGVPRNVEMAVSMLENACQLGDALACEYEQEAREGLAGR